MDNQVNERLRLKKHFKTALIITAIGFIIFCYNLYVVITFSPSSLTGYLGILGNCVLLFFCLSIVYCVWLSYTENYSKIMIEKKHRKLPFYILLGIGIVFGILLMFYIVIGSILD